MSTKIKTITKDGNPWGDNATQTFNVELENGVSGKIYAGAKYYDYYQVGDFVEVVENIQKADKNNNVYNKLKLKKADPPSNGPQSQASAQTGGTPSPDGKSFLVKDTVNAVALMATNPANGITPDNVVTYLDKIYNWSVSKLS